MSFEATFNITPFLLSSIGSIKTLPPPEIEVSDVKHPNISYVYNAKHSECNGSVPSIVDILQGPALNFGPLNEIEYSANIKFKNVIVHSEVEHVLSRVRYYFKNTIRLYYDNSKLSTAYFDGCREFDGNIFTRVDYFNDTDSIPEISTSKLKLARTKFNYRDVTYSLTGSIEIEFPELARAMIGQPTHFSCRREFIYWIIQLTVRDEQTFMFRIAFRRKDTKNGKYECNIECEDAICGSDFITCFDLLSKYYKRQYITQNGHIWPLILDPELPILCLNQEQREILKTIKHIPYPHDSEQILDPNITNFIKFLSSKESIHPDVSMESFANIKSDESMNFIESYDEADLDDIF